MLISQHGDKHLDKKQRRRCEIITRLIANKISSSEASGFFAHAQQDQTGSISGKVTFKNKVWPSILVIAIDPNYSDGKQRSHNRALTDIDETILLTTFPQAIIQSIRSRLHSS